LIAPRGPEALSPEFILFWLSRPEDQRNATDARTEEYRDYADFQGREIFSPQLRSLLSKELSPVDAYAEGIKNIVIALAWDPEVRSDPAYAERHLKQIESLIRSAWGIEKNAAHRLWTWTNSTASGRGECTLAATQRT
jgi:hypothetical protein